MARRGLLRLVPRLRGVPLALILFINVLMNESISRRPETGDAFRQRRDSLLAALRPLYHKLHAYLRYRLRALYPGRFGARNPIPVHLLGACPAQLPLWLSFWTRTHAACEHFNKIM